MRLTGLVTAPSYSTLQLQQPLPPCTHLRNSFTHDWLHPSRSAPRDTLADFRTRLADKGTDLGLDLTVQVRGVIVLRSALGCVWTT